MRRTVLAAVAIGALWLAGVASALLPLPFGGTYLGLGVAWLFWLVVIGGCWALGAVAGRRWLTVTAVSGAVALYLLSFNWVALAPQAWFDVHRPMYDAALDHVDRSDDLYGDRLPLRWRWLTVDGRAAARGGDGATGDEVVFFPQWYGIPDDGGGYLWSPGGPPEGYDMAGMVCTEPVDLGDGWWMCGMG